MILCAWVVVHINEYPPLQEDAQMDVHRHPLGDKSTLVKDVDVL